MESIFIIIILDIENYKAKGVFLNFWFFIS